MSSNTPSRIERRPRAPVLRSRARLATDFRASERNSRSTPSISNNLAYCLVRAFFGSVRICINAASSSSSRVASTGRRPTNSGIRPNLTRSSGSTSRRDSPTFLPSSLLRTSAPKPMPPLVERFWMTFSRPENAPPQMNRMLRVSTCRNSCCGCLRPPCGGTEATVPSISFSSACCTPSPETSRVMDGLSDLREILSISSM
ncbi:hypothetical protein D9M73_149680 [compost metagenome]